MAVGLGLLQLSPDAFWSMTLKELERALSIFYRCDHSRMSREKLLDMMKAFPDTREN